MMTRRLPGFVWIRVVVVPSWRRGSWWAVRGIVRTHALGPLRLVTMRDDCLERAHASGILPS
jgi:hypothetical protein